MAATPLYLGLMSGTSADGIDAVLARFPDSGGCTLIASLSRAYPDALRQSILSASVRARALNLQTYAQIDARVGQAFAQLAANLVERSGVPWADVAAVGSHGQTLFHDPLGNSLQVGDPNRIAIACGRPVVADFRRADMAAGGQGAPLVPAFHRAMFGRTDEDLCIINLGGIANLSHLPSCDGPVRGFDTGPANGLLDEWMQTRRGCAFDADGALARSGTVHRPLLDALLADPYFQQPPPKSTGRDHFNLEWCRARFPALDTVPDEDVARTLLELTVQSVADSLAPLAGRGTRVLLCGGGADNGYLVERLREQLAPRTVGTTADGGIDPKWVEAAAFAWLAKRRMEGLPGNLPSATGAHRAVVLGAIYQP